MSDRKIKILRVLLFGDLPDLQEALSELDSEESADLLWEAVLEAHSIRELQAGTEKMEQAVLLCRELTDLAC